MSSTQANDDAFDRATRRMTVATEVLGVVYLAVAVAPLVGA